MNTAILNAIAAKLPGFQCPPQWDDVTVAALVGALFEQHYSLDHLMERDAGGGLEDAIASDKAIRAHIRRRVQPAIRQLRAAKKIARKVLANTDAVVGLDRAENELLRAAEDKYREQSAFDGGLSINELYPAARDRDGRPRAEDYDLTITIGRVLKAAGYKRQPAAHLIAQLLGTPQRGNSIMQRLHDAGF